MEKPFAMPPKKYPLIYISLETIVNNATSFYKKCIRAFEHENVQVIMSIGNSVSKDRFGKIPDNFSIYSFVPQLEVLENTDIFITHGGMNSITESLYYGVPMIVIPFMTDQPLNAKRIEELHLGKKLEYKNSSIPTDRLILTLFNFIILAAASQLVFAAKAQRKYSRR